jgi:DNA-binding transcriptional ArsR family regulator
MLNQDTSLDQMFQALADPTRRLLLENLSRGPASVSELAKPLAISLPAVMQHLQLLEASGLVSTRKIGRVRTCSLDTQALQAVETWVQQRRTFWTNRLDRLGAYLAMPAEDAETPPGDDTTAKE